MKWGSQLKGHKRPLREFIVEEIVRSQNLPAHKRIAGMFAARMMVERAYVNYKKSRAGRTAIEGTCRRVK